MSGVVRAFLPGERSVPATDIVNLGHFDAATVGLLVRDGSIAKRSPGIPVLFPAECHYCDFTDPDGDVVYRHLFTHSEAERRFAERRVVEGIGERRQRRAR